jgi:DNA invertase Pin-like site-specific DNA recombinase
MPTILRPDTQVTVEYDAAKGRTSRTFPNAYAARRFYAAKDKAGKHPAVKGEQSAAKGVACYVRVSTVGQNEAGQRAELERWLSGNGVDPASVSWFVDKKSGDNLQRPAFTKLQAAVFSGEVGTIVVYKLDRLSRSLVDGINVLADWCNRKLRVVSVTQQLDFNGAVGQLLAAVLLGIAAMEQETRRERQAVGIAEAKRNGVYKGRRAGTTKAKPDRAAKLRAKGLLTVEEIAASLKVSRRTAYRYLRQAQSQPATTTQITTPTSP